MKNSTNTLKFFYNGIKENGGKLQPCFYTDGKLINFPEGTLTIYEKGYAGFSKGVCEAFKVTNDTEIQSDYIVGDVIRVEPSHPLYFQVLAALNARRAHYAKVNANRESRRAARKAA